MPFRLKPDESFAAGIARIAIEQVDRAETGRGPLGERIHEVRTRCKKIRALLLLGRPYFPALYRRENSWFRDLSRALSKVRDVDAMIESFAGLQKGVKKAADRRKCAQLRQQLEAYRTSQQPSETELRLLARHLQQLHKRRSYFRKIKNNRGGLSTEGLAQTYRCARKRFHRALGTDSGRRFHNWRKQVKYFQYQIRLLRSAWPPLMKEMEKQAKALADLLGEDHDLGLLRQFFSSRTDKKGKALVFGLIDRRREKVRAEAIDLGRRLFAEKPGAFRRQVAKWWKAARQD